MPLFTFECNDCSKFFEELIQSTKNNCKKKCIYCNSKNTKKLLGKCGIVISSEGTRIQDSENVGKMDGVARRPIISDRNTGKVLGYGDVEMPT